MSDSSSFSDSELEAMRFAIQAILAELRKGKGIGHTADSELCAKSDQLRQQGGVMLTGIAAQIDKLLKPL